MAFTCRTFCTNYQIIRHITKPVKWSIQKYCPEKILASGFYYSSNTNYKPLGLNNRSVSLTILRYYSTQNVSSNIPEHPDNKPKKPSMMQRLKEMYTKYWYVALPVHLVTSGMWLGSFYYLVRNGLDVLGILESLGISEKLLAPLRDSKAGYLALSFALYKAVSPLRYAVTLGATTFAINKLTLLGWIKPVPSTERLKEMMQEKKGTFIGRKMQYQTQMRERKDHLQNQMIQKQSHWMDEIRRYKEEVKNRVKKM